MADIDIKVKATSDLSGISEATDAVKDLGDAGTEAGGDGSSKGLSWLAVAAGGVAGGLASGIMEKAPEVIDLLNRTGEAAIKASGNFKAFGGDSSTLESMREATSGLVSDVTLMQSATTLMKDDLSVSNTELGEIAKVGASLGKQFGEDAAEGVRDFGKAITEVGTYSTLDDLGLDADDVRKKFNELKEIMGDEDAWKMAVLEEARKTVEKLPDALDGAGTAVGRFQTRITNFVAETGASFVTWLDEALTKLEQLLGWSDKVATQQSDRDSVQNAGTQAGVTVDAQDSQRAADYYRTGRGGSSAYQSLVRTYGQEAADAMIRSMGDRPAALDQIAEESGGFQPYYARYIPGYGQQQPSAPTSSRHSSRSGDITGEGEGYGMYESPASPSTGRRTTGAPATIEKPTVTAAEFDAIVRSANQASAATVAFGAASTLAMGGLALSSAIAAGQVGNLTSQGESALSIFKQLQIEMKTLASLSITVTSTRQAGGSGGDTTPARGPR